VSVTVTLDEEAPESVTSTVIVAGATLIEPPKGTGLLSSVPDAKTRTGFLRVVFTVPSPSIPHWL